jgi:hypothetical protein
LPVGTCKQDKAPLSVAGLRDRSTSSENYVTRATRQTAHDRTAVRRVWQEAKSLHSTTGWKQDYSHAVHHAVHQYRETHHPSTTLHSTSRCKAAHHHITQHRIAQHGAASEATQRCEMQSSTQCIEANRRKVCTATHRAAPHSPPRHSAREAAQQRAALHVQCGYALNDPSCEAERNAVHRTNAQRRKQPCAVPRRTTQCSAAQLSAEGSALRHTAQRRARHSCAAPDISQQLSAHLQ